MRFDDLDVENGVGDLGAEKSGAREPLGPRRDAEREPCGVGVFVRFLS